MEHKLQQGKFRADIRENNQNEDDQTLEQVAQRCFIVSILRDIKNMTR